MDRQWHSHDPLVQRATAGPTAATAASAAVGCYGGWRGCEVAGGGGVCPRDTLRAVPRPVGQTPACSGADKPVSFLAPPGIPSCFSAPPPPLLLLASAADSLILAARPPLNRRGALAGGSPYLLASPFFLPCPTPAPASVSCRRHRWVLWRGGGGGGAGGEGVPLFFIVGVSG